MRRKLAYFKMDSTALPKMSLGGGAAWRAVIERVEETLLQPSGSRPHSRYA